mgnify:CR=1 FL=1
MTIQAMAQLVELEVQLVEQEHRLVGEVAVAA